MDSALLADSKVFPGTTRDWWVYVPAQYEPGTPANLLLCFDGGGVVKSGVLMDNLIHKRAVPVTIVVGITPGRNPDYQEQRSHEYDTVSDANATFLATEVLPLVEALWNISADPARRCSLGGSSGGIAAFSAAWFRPDLFGCVVCWVGSFTNIRGGHNYPWLVRNTARKPIKVYLSDGRNDLNNQHGAWPLANQQMAAALDYAGYTHHFDFGEGNHGSGPRGPPAVKSLQRGPVLSL
jgi:enterochelin esterase-like enzyme